METLFLEKLELTRKEEQELRIFFIIGKKGAPVTEEKVIAPLAYKLEEAFEKAKIGHQNYLLLYNGQNMTIRELLAQLQLEKIISPPTNQEKTIEVPPEPLEKINFEHFKNCLLLVLDDYVSEEKKESLREIIKDIKKRNRI